MPRKKKIIETKSKEFFIMNKNAQFFMGLYGGEVLWTNKIEEAKSFEEESKITMLKRYHPDLEPQIVYT